MLAHTKQLLSEVSFISRGKCILLFIQFGIKPSIFLLCLYNKDNSRTAAYFEKCYVIFNSRKLPVVKNNFYKSLFPTLLF